MNNEHWMNSRWRPAMGWSYMAICLFDFIIAPIFWGVLQAYFGDVKIPYSPITLQGGGLFHVAMGAVVGITSYGRTKEKLNALTKDK